jgi:hypothetical protein
MQKSQYIIKSFAFHRILVKWNTQLFTNGPVVFKYVLLIIFQLEDSKKYIILCTITSGSHKHPSSLSDVPQYWLCYLLVFAASSWIPSVMKRTRSGQWRICVHVVCHLYVQSTRTCSERLGFDQMLSRHPVTLLVPSTTTLFLWSSWLGMLHQRPQTRLLFNFSSIYVTMTRIKLYFVERNTAF